MTKPFEHVLGLIPKGVMAGLFVSCTRPPVELSSHTVHSGTWVLTRSLRPA